jgi:hypothetical protein
MPAFVDAMTTRLSKMAGHVPDQHHPVGDRWRETDVHSTEDRIHHRQHPAAKTVDLDG